MNQKRNMSKSSLVILKDKKSEEHLRRKTHLILGQMFFNMDKIVINYVFDVSDGHYMRTTSTFPSSNVLSIFWQRTINIQKLTS